MNKNSNTLMTGELGLTVHRAIPNRQLTPVEFKKYGTPQRGLPEEVNDWRSDNRRSIKDGLKPIKLAEKHGIATFYGSLFLRKQDGQTGLITNFGLAGLRLVTTTGVTEIALHLGAGTPSPAINIFKYHGIGTGGTGSSPSGESASDTALVTECTTAYSINNTRATGTQTPSTNTYQTVGTVTVDASVAAIEHGIFNHVTVGSGVLLDRTCFAVVNLASGDSLSATYTLTLTAGG